VPFFTFVEQAQGAFSIFVVVKNGDISKFEIKNIIISIYKEKDDIEKSMRDSGLALKKLDLIMKFLSILIIGLIGMAMLTEGYSTVMISLGTVWASTLFAVSGIITTIVENIIFLFISHPFDVGDKIQVGGDVMYVTEFGLISTVFRRTDGKKLYAPNKAISNKFIKNVRRSGTIIEDIDLEVSLNTTKEQFEELKRRILEFLKQHKNDFQLRAEIALKSLHDVGHINLGIMIEHNINFQDTFKYNVRRNELLLMIQSLLNELGISLYHENSYDVKLTCSNPAKLPIIAALSSNVQFPGQ
jgi:small-conductance mechanosensitive channel